MRIRLLSATLAVAALAGTTEAQVGLRPEPGREVRAVPAGISKVVDQAHETGRIVGRIFDARTAEAVRGVAVEVDGPHAQRVVTDLHGEFRLELPPGTYLLKLTAACYVDSVIADVAVVAGKATKADAVMAQIAAGETVRVEAAVKASESTAHAMLVERKSAGSVSDMLSKEEIRFSVASDAAGAIQQVTGVSIVDDGYVYVRGLGERYSATMLNDAMVPTTDPERRVVPLDLFPSSLIDSVTVVKTYAPDLPGEFSGGLVRLRTIEFPAESKFSIGVSNSVNSLTTFRRFSTYDGGGGDFFGFGGGSRAIPAAIPADNRLFAGRFDSGKLQAFGRSFSSDWEPRTASSMRPGQGMSVAGGTTFKRVGIVGAVTFANALRNRRELQRYLVNAGEGRVDVFTEYPDFASSSESIRLGGVFNVALQLSAEHKLVFRNTWTRDTDKEVREFTGLNGGIDSVIRATRLRWVEQAIVASGVEGEHATPKFLNSLFRWQVTFSASSRNEPDLRETIRGRREDGTFAFLALPQSGLRFFNKFDDRIHEPLMEWSVPFVRGRVAGQLKTGFRGAFRSRDFAARRFRFVPVRADRLEFTLPTNELLGPGNIRPDGFEIRENTRGTDACRADMDVYGAFVMVDVSIGPRLRVVGGVRYEDARIGVTTEDPLVPGAIPAISRLDNRDPLPSVNFIFSTATKQNLRVGYGATLSRPDFRELSPFDFTNVLGGFNTVGNPGLRRAKIHNYDVRWEWFPGDDQIVAASYFVKDFRDPIETTVQPTTDLRQSYVNARGALNQGVELEFRRGLGALHKILEPFSVHANATIVASNVEIDRRDALLLTSSRRPLVGQARSIFNVVTEWNRPQWRSQARLFVNSVSRRISDVGTFGLPDIYQERNLALDFVYQYRIGDGGRWNVRLAAENLTDNRFRWTQGDFVQRSFRVGRTFSIGMTFSLF